MAKCIQAVRGMNDILPTQTPYWQYLEKTFQQIAASFVYAEIRFPIVEHTGLFKRSIGEVTDIVEKEMYTFDDEGDSLTLRPEGTAGCVRAGIEQGLLYNQIQRLWYSGPMFRHERPQLGRYRQFYQIGVETFGMSGPDIDAELIMMTAQLWQQLGLSNKVVLQINSLGTSESRQQHRERLVQYYQTNFEQLDEDSQRRLTSNPLRILDSKNPEMIKLNQDAPKLLEHLDEDSKQHFESLQQMLQAAAIPFEINPCLVRGLDYYSQTVFEWVTDELGSQGTVCAGGRYDSLVETLGGKATPACGFAMGIERIVLMLEKLQPLATDIADIYIVSANDAPRQQGLIFAQQIRQQFPEIRVLSHCGSGSLKNQFKRADKCGAKLALIIADDELANDSVTIKHLRDKQPQVTIARQQINEYISKMIKE